MSRGADPLRFDAATDMPQPSSRDGFPSVDSPGRVKTVPFQSLFSFFFFSCTNISFLSCFKENCPSSTTFRLPGLGLGKEYYSFFRDVIQDLFKVVLAVFSAVDLCLLEYTLLSCFMESQLLSKRVLILTGYPFFHGQGSPRLLLRR